MSVYMWETILDRAIVRPTMER